MIILQQNDALEMKWLIYKDRLVYKGVNYSVVCMGQRLKTEQILQPEWLKKVRYGFTMA